MATISFKFTNSGLNPYVFDTETHTIDGVDYEKQRIPNFNLTQNISQTLATKGYVVFSDKHDGKITSVFASQITNFSIY